MIGTAVTAAILLAILRELVLIRRAVVWTEIDLAGLEETD